MLQYIFTRDSTKTFQHIGKEMKRVNMNLKFNLESINGYHSNSQKARVLTESWVEENLFCPRCGNNNILRFPNNKPVADFYCPHCQSQYELKSKNGTIKNKISDGAYDTMIRRITSLENPDFLFMSYSSQLNCVKDLMFIPKHFFVPNIIEARKPLSPTSLSLRNYANAADNR
jgi:type II restriction enzyme